MQTARSLCLVDATLKSEINSAVHVVGAFVYPAEPRQMTFLEAKFG